MRASGGGKKNPRALTQVVGTVTDPGVRRYRPLVIVAEAQADDGGAMQRAEWEMRRRRANGTKATITINGWRQEDGRLWSQNELIEVTAPWLGLDERELIISQVQFSSDDSGELTELSLTLPDAFLPDPKRKGKKAGEGGSKGKKKGTGGGDMWGDVVGTG
jgi:prophage tail gpP-like protein